MNKYTHQLYSLTGTRTPKYVEESLEALKVTLSPEDINAIGQASVGAELSGDHYPPGYMQFLYGDTPELPK